MSLAGWLALGSSLLLLIGVLSLIGLHLNAPDLTPIRDAVSLYVYGGYGVLYRVQAVATGLGALCLLGALLVHGFTLPLIGVVLFGLYGATRIMMAWFISDPHPPLTRRGVIHLLLGTVMFLAIAFATGLLTGPLRVLPEWQRSSIPLILAATLTIGCVALSFALSTQARLRPLLGLVERGIYVGTFVWMGWVVWPLLPL